MARKNITSGSPFEKPVGFSRAVRVGNVIAIAGTAPIQAGGETACPGDAYGQTKRCLEIIEIAIQNAGGQLSDVIRTRMMLTNIDCWEEVARAHGEFFANIRPAATMVEVKRLIEPDWLVEIEADCLLEE